MPSNNNGNAVKWQRLQSDILLLSLRGFDQKYEVDYTCSTRWYIRSSYKIYSEILILSPRKRSMIGLNFNWLGELFNADFTARGHEVSSFIPRENVSITFPLITLEGDSSLS